MKDNNYHVAADIAEKISVMSPGTLVMYVQIADWLGIGANTDRNQIYPVMCRVRRILEPDYNIFLKTIPKKGYMIVPRGKEYIQVEGQWNAGIRTMCRAAERHNYIDPKGMTEEDLAATMKSRQKMSNLYGLITA